MKLSQVLKRLLTFCKDTLGTVQDPDVQVEHRFLKSIRLYKGIGLQRPYVNLSRGPQLPDFANDHPRKKQTEGCD